MGPEGKCLSELQPHRPSVLAEIEGETVFRGRALSITKQVSEGELIWHVVLFQNLSCNNLI